MARPGASSGRSTSGWPRWTAGGTTRETPLGSSPRRREETSPLGSVTDELCRTTQFRVDRFGYFTEPIEPQGAVTVLSRDANGLVTQLTEPDPNVPGGTQEGAVTQFAYDGKGNLTQVTHPDATTKTWTYDATFSQVTTYTDEENRVAAFGLDNNGNRGCGVADVHPTGSPVWLETHKKDLTPLFPLCSP